MCESDEACDQSFEDSVKKMPKSKTKKKITDMSAEEKNQIIAELKSGVESDFYELKRFNNGSCRLINKKKTTTAKETPPRPPSVVGGVNLTNEQWIIQSIMDNKIENAVLRTKLKKYKKRLNDLYITAEDEDVSIPVQQPIQQKYQEPVQQQYQEPVQQQYQEPVQQHYEEPIQQHYEEPIQQYEQPKMSRHVMRRRK